MGTPVLILGESGSGKSTSLRNFPKDAIAIFNIAGKPFPFRQKFDHVCSKPNASQVAKVLSHDAPFRAYVIDDSQYLMAFEAFARAQEGGYAKFTDIAVHFYEIIKAALNAPEGTIVYFLHHVEQGDNGKTKAKTIGKMLDNQLSIEGLFPIVLMAQTDGEDHWFETQSNGYNTCKSPMEMFPPRIPNDLAAVDAAIREYWQYPPLTETKETN